ncbi:hypothetical protein LSUB1_G008516 [Lachnellula subtilissima]|uniref:Uncharacterized protein n=1 Tax=Lachnellula subtilissima TaxID=602034 RepID=A0A8H8RGA0_9HELO|nr:hypothetical protein LSUB1_G008516 [Lachnellula subtilissima]
MASMLPYHGCEEPRRPRTYMSASSLDRLLGLLATNYIAHAGTLISHPGESIQETVIAAANALFIPGSGVLRAFRFLVLYLSPRLTGSRHRYSSTPLGQAERAGALCMVVQERVLGRALESTTGTPRFSFGENIRSVPIAREIHGVCVLPMPRPGVPKYCLVEVPPHMPLRPWPLDLGSGSDSKSGILGLDSLGWNLGKNYNVPKIMISILQIVWGILTLYKTRGDQIALFGYGEFGLTVAPYAIMSIINLATNLVRLEYAAMYLVRSPEMDAAISHGGEFQGIMQELVIFQWMSIQGK